MSALSPAQRKFLKSLAHHLDPVVIIGKQGVTDMLVRAAVEALEAHELIKIRFNEFKDQKKELAQELVRRTGAEQVGLIGHVLILYREHPEEEHRKISLPVN